ncbi:MAG TPA: GrpB family protein [bacterium]|nr:GrpB family protein [bacterium]
MLTPEQERWINHLSDDDKVIIKPFDSSAVEKFEAVKQRILSTLGDQTRVEHCGATSLGISGQDEIDIYVPALVEKFDILLPQLRSIFGEPKSLYPGERVRFTIEEKGKHIDVFLINEFSSGWIDSVKFETYLKTHPGALADYQRLKEDGNGMSTREYYRRKIHFINEILSRVSLESKVINGK